MTLSKSPNFSKEFLDPGAHYAKGIKAGYFKNPGG